ncbi:hypothetical protein SAMN05216207_10156 [Pseudonocardia ammonioxydans]|uniref:Uncharacterized protein n=1 Tax=Pseudonocardia ammonioxydans TaxID=260086 RepID=A0A1I4ZDF2_PSUAM|nr:hypothetical protein [Pseudonocardia ammonioxydans]SFN48009.1 hypothetical protein SAMN05216207_10156 [Pseudonocardia ammonioxydans]
MAEMRNDATIAPDHLGRSTLVVESNDFQMGHPVMDGLRADRAADGAADSLKRAGIPIPERVASAYVVFAAIKSPVAPEPPSLMATPKQVDAYYTAYSRYLVERDAHEHRVFAGRQELKKLVAASTGEVLDSIRDRFDAAAAEFVEAHRALSGVASLQDAAADATGDLVKLWHQRDRASAELNKITNAVNGWLKANRNGEGLKSMQLVALVAAPTHGCRDLYARIRDDKSPHARWAALTDAGWSLELAASMSDYRARYDVIDDRLEDATADDPSVRVESIGVVQGRGSRLAR